jgi:hypothetical protein
MGRGKSQRTLDTVRAVTEIYQAIQPASLRAVCYQLFNAKLIASMAKKETNRVSRIVRIAREEELIPWEWVVDETRKLERVAQWDDPDDFADSIQSQYRRDRWQHQPQQVEIWSEKGTIRGAIQPVLDAYGVGFRVMHGYGSATAVHDAADASWDIGTEPLLAIYIGDWDPSGLHMSTVDLPRRLTKYEGNVKVVRLALTAKDVALGNLPGFPAGDKRKDPRYKWSVSHYGHQCWELDALNPVTLRARLEAAIVEVIDPATWNRDARAEEAEHESLLDVLHKWKSACA